MVSVRICLSGASRVMHGSFHGKCTGKDYDWLENEGEEGAESRVVFTR